MEDTDRENQKPTATVRTHNLRRTSKKRSSIQPQSRHPIHRLGEKAQETNRNSRQGPACKNEASCAACHGVPPGWPGGQPRTGSRNTQVSVPRPAQAANHPWAPAECPSAPPGCGFDGIPGRRRNGGRPRKQWRGGCPPPAKACDSCWPFTHVRRGHCHP